MEWYGAYSENTVWQGCVRLWDDREWLVAGVVFLASMVISLLKLIEPLFLVAVCCAARGAPVLYRGFEVGDVQDSRLNTAATAVDIDVTIRPQYTKLVRSNSRFWNVSGANAHFGLFKGLQVNVQSLRSLVVGGIAFSTPENPKAGPAKNGMVFHLNGGTA